MRSFLPPAAATSLLWHDSLFDELTKCLEISKKLALGVAFSKSQFAAFGSRLYLSEEHASL